MEREEFAKRLQAATQVCFECTRGRVVEALPSSVLYLICPNCSYSGRPLADDEEQFPEDNRPIGQVSRPSTDAAGVIAFLWRHGKVPGWINAQIIKSDNLNTFIFLSCSSQFTSGDHVSSWDEGPAPFRPFGPGIPHTWKFLKISEQLREAWTPEIEAQYWERMIALNGKITLGNSYLDLLQQVEEKRRLSEG